MHFSRLVRCLVLVLVVTTLVSCGKKVTPEQRLVQLRNFHEIIPVGSTTLNRDTNPTLLVDVQVINQGTVPLKHLTVMLGVNGADGVEMLRMRVTLDLEGLRPGIGGRRSAMVEGFALAEDDEVFVELEGNLSPEELRQLPEFADLEGLD